MNKDPAHIAMVRDIGMHAAKRAHDAVTDACNLIDDDDFDFTIVINVIAALTCAAAKMIPDKETHEERIAVVIGLLTRCMTAHIDHGDDDDHSDHATIS